MKLFHLFSIFFIVLFVLNCVASQTPVFCGEKISFPGNYILDIDEIDYSEGNCIEINSSNVFLDCQGHILDGTDQWFVHGIVAKGVVSDPLKNISLKNCVLTGWSDGINFQNAGGIISNFDISSVLLNGISLMNSNQTKVSFTNVSGGTYGIFLDNSHENIFDSINFKVPYTRVYFSNSNNNSVLNSFFYFLGRVGVHIGGDNNFILNNTFLDSIGGSAIEIEGSFNVIKNNFFENNSPYGISVQSINSNNNYIYNNFFNNLNNLYIEEGAHNFWNTSINCAEENILDGNCIGGNYWADYDFFDFDGDGFGDVSYILDSNNVDFLPLVFNSLPSINSVECKIGSNPLWFDFCPVSFYENITAIRVNCTSTLNQVENVLFDINNLPDSKNIFYGFVESPGADGFWTVDGINLNINDSGETRLSVICTDNNSLQFFQNKSFNLPWGILNSKIISPPNNISVLKDKFFTFVSEVECVGGECGDVVAILDPIPNLKESSQEFFKESFLDSENFVEGKYIIEFEDLPIIDYQIGKEKQLKIIPGLIRKELVKIFVNSHKNSIEEKQKQIIKKIKKENPNLKIKNSYKKIFNGFEIEGVSFDEVNFLKSIPGIKGITPSRKVFINLDETIPLLGANSVWLLKDSFGENITGKEITVGIIDTGINYSHSDLGGCFGDGCRIFGGWDFVNNDSDPMDDNGHGTHCAGIVGGKGDVYVGVAPDVNFYAYKTMDDLGHGDEGDIIAAIEQSIDPNQDGDFSDHLDVISISLGGFPIENDPMAKAVDSIVDFGIVAVVAVGNSGPYSTETTCRQSMDPFGDYYSICSPGTSKKAISVGAVGKDEIIKGYSGRGPTSEGIMKPDVVSPTDAVSCSLSGDYSSFSGTSGATPHVAGAVALIKQAHPDWTASEIKHSLRNTAVDLGYEFNVGGYGRIDVFQAILLDEPPPVAFLNTFGKFNPGLIEIYGTAESDSFVNYTLEIGSGFEPTVWVLLNQSTNEVVEGILGVLNTSNFPGAYHTIKLSVFDYFNHVTEERAIIFVSGQEVECNGCNDCTFKSSIEGTKLILTQDIDTSLTECIGISSDNIVLDCGGHFIKFNGPYSSLEETGINLGGHDNFTLKNCLINDFQNAVWAFDSDNLTIINNTFDTFLGSQDEGINSSLYLGFSDNFNISNNQINSLGLGIYLYSGTNGFLVNNTINSQGVAVLSNPTCNDCFFYYNTFNSSVLDFFLLTNAFTPTNIYNNNFVGTANPKIHAFSFNNDGVEISYNNRGNFWGRTISPYFISGVHSYSENTTDSYPYNRAYLAGQWPDPPSSQAQWKGRVSTVVGSTPFYTIDNNPKNFSNTPCLKNMLGGQKCQVSWQINATGDIDDLYEFFAVYDSFQYNFIGDSETGHLFIKISNEGVSADLNNDGVVNLEDLTIVVYNQKQNSTAGGYSHLDINEDGEINFKDVEIVINEIFK